MPENWSLNAKKQEICPKAALSAFDIHNKKANLPVNLKGV